MPTYCLPVLSSVPGFPASEFPWWSVPADLNSLRTSPENPNWLGSFSLSEGAGANRDMQFRALRGFAEGQNYLFLSWVVRASALATGLIDRVNVLLSDGTNYVAFRARLGTPSSTTAGTQDGGVFSYAIHSCTASASGAITQNNPPIATQGANLETTGRMWVDVTNPQRQLHTSWAFQVAIPLGVAWAPSALNLPTAGSFKLWYEVWTTLPNGATVPYQVLTTPSSVKTTSILQVIPSGLQVAHLLDMSTGTTGCTAGVTINYTSVGVRNVDGSSRLDPYTIQLDLGQNYPPNLANPSENPGGISQLYDEAHTPNVTNPQGQNQFYARPDVTGLTAAQQGAVHGRFSLANWGSQLSNPTSSSWRPIPGGEDVPYQNALAEMRFAWPKFDTDVSPASFTTVLVRNINKYLNHVWNNTLASVPSAQNPHHCVLLELTSSDPSVVLTRSSIYINMNVVGASTYRDQARISIEDLAPINPGPRDVYLYVQKFNMPNKVTKPQLDLLQRTFDAVPRDNLSTGPVGERPPIQEVEDIAVFYPTYIIHTYHDTGETMQLEGGRKTPIYRPQTAFGYFVLHDGNLVGWETRLYNAEKIAEDFYHLSVPNNGATYVEVAIQARESDSEQPLPPDGAIGCCSAIAAWLETKGSLGKSLAVVVRLICRLVGQTAK
jgi:hypothetical protein